MAAPTAVFPDAPPTAGRFPLVLHSLGRNGGQFESTILWEYLASHGYVVASVGQFGRSLEEPALEFSWEDQSLQLADMRAALLHLVAMSNISAEQVGLLGHSSGAVVALLLAAEDDRVHGVVGLDGSMNREEGRQLLESGLGERRLSTPVLNLCRWPHPEFDEGIPGRTDESTIRIGYARAIHFDFQNWPAYQSYADAEEQRSLKVRTVDEARRVFESAAVFARLFLDAELKDDDGALEKLTDARAVAEISRGLATLKVIGAE